VDPERGGWVCVGGTGVGGGVAAARGVGLVGATRDRFQAKATGQLAINHDRQKWYIGTLPAHLQQRSTPVIRTHPSPGNGNRKRLPAKPADNPGGLQPSIQTIRRPTAGSPDSEHCLFDRTAVSRPAANSPEADDQGTGVMNPGLGRN
jgi:hypothetical protein